MAAASISLSRLGISLLFALLRYLIAAFLSAPYSALTVRVYVF
jgi:hypothetical protein